MSKTDDEKQKEYIEKQKEYMDFLNTGLKSKTLYSQGRRPGAGVTDIYIKTKHDRDQALQNISLENFNSVLKNNQDVFFEDSGSTKDRLIKDYLSYHTDVTKEKIYTTTTFGTLLGYRGGRKSLKIKRSARHKKSHSKSIKRRKRSKK
jgi:hypothetical protein